MDTFIYNTHSHIYVRVHAYIHTFIVLYATGIKMFWPMNIKNLSVKEN